MYGTSSGRGVERSGDGVGEGTGHLTSRRKESRADLNSQVELISAAAVPLAGEKPLEPGPSCRARRDVKAQRLFRFTSVPEIMRS